MNKNAKKILIVEDNHSLVEILKIRLKNKGYEVLVAFDGVSGLDMAKTWNPQLIVLDIELPGINGFTICGLLKADEKFKTIPILMLTARRGERDRTFDENFKPEAFMTKPFDSQDFMAKVAQLLGEAS